MILLNSLATMCKSHTIPSQNAVSETDLMRDLNDIARAIVNY